MSAVTEECTDGVQLDKYVEKDGFELPSVVYEIRSERTEAMVVEVVESLPAGLEPNQFAFHRDFDPEVWDVSEDELVLETTIEPGSAYEAVYGVRTQASIEVNELAASPAEFTVTPAGETVLGDAVPGSDSRSKSSTPDDGTTQFDETQPARDEVEQGRATDAVEQEQATDERLESDGNSTDNGAVDGDAMGPSTASEDESRDGERAMVDELVAELRSGRGSDDSLRYLRQELGAPDNSSGSTDARIRQLQREFADLRAYSGALEEFIDENGPAREMLNSFEDHLESIEGDVAALESTVSRQETEVADLRTELRKAQADVRAVSAEMDSLTVDVDELSSEYERIDEQLPADDVEDRITELEADIAEMSEFTSKLQAAFQESFRV